MDKVLYMFFALWVGLFIGLVCGRLIEEHHFVEKCRAQVQKELENNPFGLLF